MTEKDFSTSRTVNQLINVSEININGEPVNSVDARELHLFLGSKQEFANWIKNKVVNSPFFQENIDYILLDNFVKAQPCTSQPLSANRKDYALTQDTAKKVSMSEQTARGNEARDYFIKCEKIAKQVKQPAHIPEIVQCQLLGAETISRMLNYSETSKVDIVKRVYEINNVDSSFLPAYIENVKIVLSATELLKRNECELKVRAFNSLLIDQGYLEEKTRPSSGGKIKSFKALTEKGLAYGQNDASPQNKLEIQPHYFEDSFMDLYRIITGE